MELTLIVVLILIILSFICEYMDSTLGMGYGTTLTPVFMLMGFTPSEIVPAILVSELVTGFLASLCHHGQGNVNFRPRNRDIFRIYYLVHPLEYYHRVRRSFPLHLKVALLFGICSSVGAVAAVLVAVNIPKFWLKMYIGVLVLSMGILILIFFNRKIKFSTAKITVLGLMASFNKGLSGGGLRPSRNRRPDARWNRRQKRCRHYFPVRITYVPGRGGNVFADRQGSQLAAGALDNNRRGRFGALIRKKCQVYQRNEIKIRYRRANHYSGLIYNLQDGVLLIYWPLPQHFLYFFPEPQGQGSLRPTLGVSILMVGVLTSPCGAWAACL